MATIYRASIRRAVLAAGASSQYWRMRLKSGGRHMQRESFDELLARRGDNALAPRGIGAHALLVALHTHQPFNADGRASFRRLIS